MLGEGTIEIERKFLVPGDAWKDDATRASATGEDIRQGYLARTARGIVRIRTYGARAFLAVKTSRTGLARNEYEYEVPVAHARAMLAACEGAVIEKTRYRVPHGRHVWDIDVFAGANTGLVLAEIELTSEDEAFERPVWIGREVSFDPRFGNAELSLHPYDAPTFGE